MTKAVILVLFDIKSVSRCFKASLELIIGIKKNKISGLKVNAAFLMLAASLLGTW